MKRKGDDTKARKNIYFDLKDKNQYLSCIFLSKCGRKQHKFLSIVIINFIKTYGIDIEAITPKELANFFEIFHVLGKTNATSGNENIETGKSDDTIKRNESIAKEKKKEQKAKRDIIRKNMSF